MSWLTENGQKSIWTLGRISRPGRMYDGRSQLVPYALFCNNTAAEFSALARSRFARRRTWCGLGDVLPWSIDDKALVRRVGRRGAGRRAGAGAQTAGEHDAARQPKVQRHVDAVE